MKTIVSAIALVAALSTTAFAGKTQNFYVWDQEAQAFVLSYTVVDTRTTLEIMIEKQQKEIAREDKPAGVPGGSSSNDENKMPADAVVVPAPVMEAPEAPVMEAPEAPVMEAPEAPVMEAPEAPVMEPATDSEPTDGFSDDSLTL